MLLPWSVYVTTPGIAKAQHAGGNLAALEVPSKVLLCPEVVSEPQGDDFGEAWRLATVNRVDLNVLVDYAWPRFLGRCSQFVAALGDDQAACDLLGALREESVAAPGGLYASALPDPPAAAQVLGSCAPAAAVKHICDTFDVAG